MAPRKYTPAQQAALDRLAQIHADRVQARTTLEMRLRAQLNDQLQVIKIKESSAANECVVLEVTKTDIGRALGTSNWDSIKDVLALTAGDYDVKDFDPRNSRYAFDGDQIRVTLTRDEAEAVMKNFGQPLPETATLSGLFEREGSMWNYVAADDEPTPLTHGYTHPVKVWTWVSENMTELSQWAAERVGA